MSDIKIFVTHSPNSNAMRVENSLFCHVVAGSDFLEQPVPQGYLPDNQGENISSKNKSYCELTTQYWAWKNQEADYYGFCHYRRFFSFNKKVLPETKWGTVEYEYLDEQVAAELHLNERDMREYIEKYDFLIAKGVNADCMDSKTIYDQYHAASDLHIEDVDLLLKIIDERHSYLSSVARRFFHGKTFYPCNMFIMKKELFQAYNKLLFDVLEEFERCANLSDYSREGYRTIGHLGERMAGIYYLYLKEKRQYRLGELQIALIHHAEEEDDFTTELADGAMGEEASVKSRVVPVVLAANQKYVPILYICIQSMVEHLSREFQYHIYVFHTDIADESQDKFRRHFVGGNVELSFVNVGKRVWRHVLQAKEHITTETYYRFLILDILKCYPKVVYLDCDTIVCRDVAELYHTELKDNLIAAVVDADFAGQCNKKNSEMRQYCLDVLKMDNPFLYFQAGVLVMNVRELRKQIDVEKLFDMSDTGIYRFSDQDILNIVCKGRVTYLDMAWNVLSDCNHFRVNEVIRHGPYYILDAYEKARKEPYIIHYAGFMKPWMNPKEDYAQVFWQAARRTEYYEELLWGMMEGMCSSGGQNRKAEAEDGIFLGTLRKILRHVFPKESKARQWAIKVYFKLKKQH